jgi:hypothetical protein
VSYLRFTPEEFRAIQQACRSIKLSDDYFAFFRYFLIEALAGSSPGLAQRLAQCNAWKLRILYGYLREQRAARVQRSDEPSRGEKDEARVGLTVREWQAVRQASSLFFLHDGKQPSFQNYLVFAFRETTPGLAIKLAELGVHQITWLFREMKHRGAGRDGP